MMSHSPVKQRLRKMSKNEIYVNSLSCGNIYKFKLDYKALKEEKEDYYLLMEKKFSKKKILVK